MLVVSQSYLSRKNLSRIEDRDDMAEISLSMYARRLKRARQLQLSLDGKYSSLPTRSIRRYLQKLGRRAYRPRTCPNWSQTDRKKRLDWCRFHEHLTVEAWNSIIFSDKAYIKLSM